MNGKQLKNSILQWAIQGKLVPQDPNDEPASVLLEKIRQEKERLIKEKKIKRDKNASIIYRGEDNSYYEKMLATGEVKCIDEEIPFEIPQGWEWCRMRDVIQLLSGRDLEPSMYNSSQKGIPYITGASNFNNENLIVNRWTQTPVTVSEEGDLLITCKGTIGTMAFNNIGSIHIARQIMAIHSKDVDLHYLKLYFELNIGTLESQANSMIPGISREVVLNSLVPIPPLQEQIKIVEKSNSLMPLVSKYSFAQGKLNLLNNVIKNKLEKTILQEAIKGKLVPQIAEEGTAHELLEQIKAEKQKLVKEGKLKKSTLNDSVIFRGDDNKYWEKKGTTCECIDEDIPFDIPKSWAWARLETILNTGSARRVHAKDWRQAGIPFYRAREIGKLADDGFVDNELYIDLSLYEDFSSSGVPLPNDLMITAVGTLGKVYIVKESDKFYYKDGSVLCLANKYGLCAEFLKMVIESPSFKGQYRQESQGTTVATLTMVRLQKYFIPLPPLQEQYRIVEMYRNIASIMS
ncbi:restriction endonuclease subunit S [Segatella copri]|uniref:restriction endonuclease subunit S n=1 Tax=Segatella copri TaxID=165179 RepID=UPI001C453879|nr:restriction endonuclease subunit S [Segatella copri]MBW0022024.1 restriction endonuclease subunit S [Segatella copri]MBW0037385.1 restriction endonuclease subunit S [Segatella copri]